MAINKLLNNIFVLNMLACFVQLDEHLLSKKVIMKIY